MNKRGFTLLELLATIIILGLLTTIVIAGILPLLNRGNNEYYATQEEMLVLAARDFFTDFRSRLPKEIGETSTVTLKELIDGKYIDPIKDRNDNDCDYENSTVVVQKITAKDYQYYVTLICDNDNNYQSDTDDKKPNIVFNPNEKTTSGTIEVKMIITDNKKVASYRYVVEKDGSVIDDSDYQNYTANPTINLTEKGTYKIIGYAIDTGGNIREKKSGTYEIYEGISCENVEFESDVEPNTWTKENITVNIKVPSNTYRYEVEKKKDNGVYEKVNSYLGAISSKVTLSESGKHTIRVTLYDDSGDSCTKESEIYYIDKVAPSCGSITGASTSWTNGNRNITVNCNDTDSGCQTGSFSKNFTTDTKTSTIAITDNAGNTKECNVNVYIDKTPPLAPRITKIGFTTAVKEHVNTCNNVGGGTGNASCEIRITINNRSLYFEENKSLSDNCSSGVCSGIKSSGGKQFYWQHNGGASKCNWTTDCPLQGAGSSGIWPTWIDYRIRLVDNAGNVGPYTRMYFSSIYWP